MISGQSTSIVKATSVETDEYPSITSAVDIVKATSVETDEYPSITSAVDAKSASNVPAQTHTVNVGNVGVAFVWLSCNQTRLKYHLLSFQGVYQYVPDQVAANVSDIIGENGKSELRTADCKLAIS